MKRLTINPLSTLLLALLFAGCGAKRENPAPLTITTIDTSITYTSAIAPMLFANCGACHIANTQSRPSFANYFDVIAKIDRIIVRAQAGTMPPAGSGYSTLSSSQVDTLKIWRASGERQ
jgi:hypothetical protein